MYVCRYGQKDGVADWSQIISEPPFGSAYSTTNKVLRTQYVTALGGRYRSAASMDKGPGTPCSPNAKYAPACSWQFWLLSPCH